MGDHQRLPTQEDGRARVNVIWDASIARKNKSRGNQARFVSCTVQQSLGSTHGTDAVGGSRLAGDRDAGSDGGEGGGGNEGEAVSETPIPFLALDIPFPRCPCSHSFPAIHSILMSGRKKIL